MTLNAKTIGTLLKIKLPGSQYLRLVRFVSGDRCEDCQRDNGDQADEKQIEKKLRKCIRTREGRDRNRDEAGNKTDQIQLAKSSPGLVISNQAFKVPGLLVGLFMYQTLCRRGPLL
ncbi:MAG: hypothetical protein ACLQLH_10010 [Terracidiphilus sp.]